eukprot:scaffold350_cov333-Pavlova_lutheri.AAC.35
MPGTIRLPSVDSTHGNFTRGDHLRRRRATPLHLSEKKLSRGTFFPSSIRRLGCRKLRSSTTTSSIWQELNVWMAMEEHLSDGRGRGHVLCRRMWLPPSPNWYTTHAVDVDVRGEEMVYAAHTGVVVLRIGKEGGFLQGRVVLKHGRGFSRAAVVAYLRGPCTSHVAVVGCQDGSLHVWDTKTSEPTKIKSTDKVPITAICGSVLSGNKAFVGRASGKFEAWTIGKRTGVLSDSISISPCGICCIAASTRYPLEAVAADAKGGLHLVCLESGLNETQKFAEHGAEVTALAWHPEYIPEGAPDRKERRTWLLSAGRDNVLKIFQFSRRGPKFSVEESRLLPLQVMNTTLPTRFSNEDSSKNRRWIAADWISCDDENELRIVTADGAGRTLLWSLQIGRTGLALAGQPSPFQSFHTRPVFCLRTLNTQGHFLSTSMDRACALWDASLPEQAPISKLSTLGGFVYALAVNGQGQVAMGCGDSVVRILNSRKCDNDSLGKNLPSDGVKNVWEDLHQSVDEFGTILPSRHAIVLWKGLPSACKVTAVCWSDSQRNVLAFGLAGGQVGHFMDEQGSARIFKGMHEGPVKQVQWLGEIVYSLGIDGHLFSHESSPDKEYSDSNWRKGTKDIGSILDEGLMGSISAFAWRKGNVDRRGATIAVAFSSGQLRVYTYENGVFEVTAGMQNTAKVSSISWNSSSTHETSNWFLLTKEDGSLAAASANLKKKEFEDIAGVDSLPSSPSHLPREQGSKNTKPAADHSALVELRAHSRKHAVSSSIWLEGDDLAVVAASADGSVSIIRLLSETSPGKAGRSWKADVVCSSQGHDGPILSAVQTGPRTFITGGEDQSIRLWYLNSSSGELEQAQGDQQDANLACIGVEGLSGLGCASLVKTAPESYSFGPISPWIADIGAKDVTLSLNAQAVSFMQLLHSESEYLGVDENVEENAVKAGALAYWRGDYALAMERFFSEGCVNAAMVNLAAGAGRSAWERATKSYASLLEKKGQVQMAALQLLAIGDVEGATKMLRRRNLEQDSKMLAAVKGLADSTPFVSNSDAEQEARRLVIEGRRGDAVRVVVGAARDSSSFLKYLHSLRNAAELCVRLTKETDSSHKEFITLAFATLASFAVVAENKGEVYERVERWTFSGSYPYRIALENLAVLSDMLRKGTFPDTAPCSSHDAAIVVETLPPVFDKLVDPAQAVARMVHSTMLRILGDTVGPIKSERKALHSIESDQITKRFSIGLNNAILNKLKNREGELGVAASAFLFYKELSTSSLKGKGRLEVIADGILLSRYARQQALQVCFERLSVAKQTLVHCAAEGTCIGDLSSDEQADLLQVLHAVSNLESENPSGSSWRECLIEGWQVAVSGQKLELGQVTLSLLTEHLEKVRGFLLGFDGFPFPPLVRSALELVRQASDIEEQMIARAIARWIHPYCVNKRELAEFLPYLSQTSGSSSTDKRGYTREELLALRDSAAPLPSTVVPGEGWKEVSA